MSPRNNLIRPVGLSLHDIGHMSLGGYRYMGLRAGHVMSCERYNCCFSASDIRSDCVYASCISGGPLEFKCACLYTGI
jgi:hypothetical protein